MDNTKTDNSVNLIEMNFLTWDTPVLLRNKQTHHVTIKNIADIMYTRDYQVWSDKGWSDITKVVKKTLGSDQLFVDRIMTYTGIVDIVENSKLYDQQMDSKHDLLHMYPNYFYTNGCLLTRNKSFIYGQYFGDDMNLEKKSVPDIILNAQVMDIFAFIQGVLTTNKYYNNFNLGEKKRIVVLGKIAAQGLYYLLRKVGYNVLLSIIQDDMYCLEFSSIIYNCENKLKKICKVKLDKNDVYSIETQSGRFNAGIGRLII